MPGDLDESLQARTFDAIVIGSGASGGWAAKELCDNGLKTIILERGREIKHASDYTTASKPPWDFKYRGTVPIEKRKDYQGARILREETLPFGSGEAISLGARLSHGWQIFDVGKTNTKME
jgi:choline dehydrogenase-like flavoprotein